MLFLLNITQSQACIKASATAEAIQRGAWNWQAGAKPTQLSPGGKQNSIPQGPRDLMPTQEVAVQFLSFFRLVEIGTPSVSMSQVSVLQI